ncbi:UPF0236 family protein [Leptolyngbya sp. FACHB-16]|uniref:UPF0236 family transposase-like protein n=1 Tax=unclassified Leptolyngbya TaxID=2650499 RepID=UPI001689D917|nr:UPF0236 family protein [Leptolyngbya sp. FACHB-16]
MCNGTREVTIKTIHGSFKFTLQRYRTSEGSHSFFELTDQLSGGYISLRLQEVSSYYSNRMSYEEVEKLIERLSGRRLLSDQKIYEIVQSKAQDVSQMWKGEVETSELLQMKALIAVKTDIDLYAEQAEEILLFEDGIQVKAQSAQRQSQKRASVEPAQTTSTTDSSVVLSDVILLQTGTGQFTYLIAPINAIGQPLVSLEARVRMQIQHTYGNCSEALPIVVISDGARVIRQRVSRLFSPGVVTILDWYHLCEKLRQLMSMVSLNRDQKRAHLKRMLSDLWHGQVESVLDYLKTQVTSKNPEKFQELVGYLEKHRHEIIDYDRRHKLGKTVGSGRMEKAVNQVFGHRQKHKGMSWRPQGSRALAILKVMELNGEWQQTWFQTYCILLIQLIAISPYRFAIA